VKQALRQSHADERWDHDEAIARLQAEHAKIQRRLDAMYDETRDGSCWADSGGTIAIRPVAD
jgi:site-specific DNA recombinase